MTSPTDDAAAKYGAVGALVQAVPELKPIFDQATAEGWTSDRFVLAVQNTQWWKANPQGVRNAVQLQATDPAEYNRQVDEYRRKLSETAAKLGTYPNFYDSPDSLAWAGLAMAEGWDDTRIQRELAYSFSPDISGAGGGDAAQIADAIRSTVAEWGVPVTDQRMGQYQQGILRGTTTIDQLNAELRGQALSAYPGLKDFITQGGTVKQAVDPYVATYAQLLEVNPQTVDWSKNTLIKQAVQGTGGDQANPQAVPLWKFEQQVKQDPQWGYTQNARAEVDSISNRVGRDMGFIS